MSAAIKPTPGPWKVSQNVSRHVVGPTGGVIASAELSCKQEISEANARLIAEAGTVHHETGLTPRQLVERVKELEEALLNLYYYVSTNIDSGFPKGVHISGAEFIEARAALSKSLPNTVAEVK